MRRYKVKYVSDEETIIDLERKFSCAIAAADFSQISELMSDGFYAAVTARNEPTITLHRDQLFEVLRKYKVRAVTIEDVHVYLHGGIAWTSLLWRQVTEWEGVDYRTDFYSTTFWSRQGGQWLIESRHFSRAALPFQIGSSVEEA